MPYHQGQNHSQGEQHQNGSAFQPDGHSRAALPDEPAFGHSVSSSHKESVQAQKKYDKADAPDKENALKEYNEKYEEAYVDG